MFDWLKRLMGRETETPEAIELARARAAKRSSRGSSSGAVRTVPTPLPEVLGEGNSQEDWGEWESSMMGIDSQMQDLPEHQRIYEKDSRYTRPSPLVDDLPDAFASARKRRDV
jgi:hypothetical protein